MIPMYISYDYMAYVDLDMWEKSLNLITHSISCIFISLTHLIALATRQNCHHFTDNIFKCIFLNENVQKFANISWKFVTKVRMYNIPALVQIMAWRRPGDKPLSEPMMVSLLTHICITLPQWVNHAIYVCVFQVPFSSPLQGSIHLRFKCLMEANVEERGFLVSNNIAD